MKNKSYEPQKFNMECKPFNSANSKRKSCKVAVLKPGQKVLNTYIDHKDLWTLTSPLRFKSWKLLCRFSFSNIGCYLFI